MSTFKEIFTNYGVFLSRRFYKKEKIRFLLFLKKDFEDLGLEVNIIQSKQEFLGEKMIYHNFYAGNLQKAKVVITTYYDTPVYELDSKGYEPFSSNRSRLSWLDKLIIPISILISASVIFYYLLYPTILQTGVWSISGIVSLIFLFLAFLLIRRYRCGVPKRQNLVRNTSSILAMLLYAKILKKNTNIAFAFIDGGTTSNYGCVMLDNVLSNTKAKVVYLDSIGSKDCWHIFTKDILNINLSGVTQHQNKQFSEFGDVLITSGECKDNRVIVNPKKYEKNIEQLEQKFNNFVEILNQLVTKL